MSYSPLDSKFLTVAEAMTVSGTKNARIVLDTETNVFYTLDDDNNFTEITDTYVTGGTISNGALTFTNNQNDSFTVASEYSGTTVVLTSATIPSLPDSPVSTPYVVVENGKFLEGEVTVAFTAGDTPYTSTGSTIYLYAYSGTFDGTFTDGPLFIVNITAILTTNSGVVQTKLNSFPLYNNVNGLAPSFMLPSIVAGNMKFITLNENFAQCYVGNGNGVLRIYTRTKSKSL